MVTVTIVGEDISQFQDGAAGSGNWAFVVMKLTEGRSVSNFKFADQWKSAAGKLRGAYHYGRPHQSDGATQARYFAAQLMARGFTPGTDLWALDVEGLGNDGVGGYEWRDFVISFMESALPILGPIGFLYVGRFFFAAELGPLTARYNWWLPDYGPNDGTEHRLPAGVNPVLHQFTSARPSLDRDAVYDVPRWNALVAHAPVPVPTPTPRSPRKVITFFQITDHPTEAARATVWLSDGLAARPMAGTQELKNWQDNAQAAGYTAEQVAVRPLPWAEAQRVAGVK